MKILVDGIPRTIGGIGTLVMNMAECARKQTNEQEFEFEFIIAKESGYLAFLTEKNYKYYIAPSVSNIREYKFFLAELFNGNKFDYLWFNNTSKVNIWLPLYAKKNGIRVITHPHGSDIEEKGIKRIVFKMLNFLNEKKMYSIIDIPFACSEKAADLFYRRNIDLRKRVMIIRNSISTSKFSFSSGAREVIRNELGINDTDILIGAVGRLTRVKNYAFLIYVLEKLEKKYKLVIIGDGEDKEELSSLIEEKKVKDRCFLLGMKTNTFDYYAAMDMFLMPSFNEGFPYSIVEAQSEGLPCIVSNTLSKELKITDLVSFVSIENTAKWVEQIKMTRIIETREKYAKAIEEKGYDIESSFKVFEKAIKGTT